MALDPRLAVPAQDSQRIAIDYSAPNVAKEMHVGHLRTTVVGDALARTLEYRGHQVIRQNHIGDWGTPFGMLIEHLLDVGEGSAAARVAETDPNAFHQAARAKFDNDEPFAARARARVVALQGGDPETMRLWGELVELSKHYFPEIYTRLGVSLTDADLVGESTYNSQLAAVCDALEAAGIAVVSHGALCVFLEGYLGREGKPVPLIIRKSDGGYGYGTTDFATIKYRVETLRADRVISVIGAPQALHLNMVWDTARKAGWLPPTVHLVHVQIGNVLGEDRKILKTRSGTPVRLMSLLDEAVTKARTVLDEARPDLVFDLDRMIALTGNTGPYLQYAAARVRSIFRTEGIDAEQANDPIIVTAPSERALALQLLHFGSVVTHVADDLEPHRLCGYLFELAQDFSAFYENCPVLKAEPDTRRSRLALCAVTLHVLVTALDLLDLDTPQRR